MNYKTDDPRKIDEQIEEDGVADEFKNLDAKDVLCLMVTESEYTRVYIDAPHKKIVSLTIDHPDKYTRMMQANALVKAYQAAGAKAKVVFG